MSPRTTALLKVIGAGLVTGAMIGTVVRFATDTKTLKYAGTGAVIGGVTYVALALIFQGSKGEIGDQIIKK